MFIVWQFLSFCNPFYPYFAHSIILNFFSNSRIQTKKKQNKIIHTLRLARIGPIIYESDEDEYILSETILIQGKVGEDARKAAGITEQIVRECTADGRIVERKIVTYPGEETEEVEEWETTEVGDEKTESHRKVGGDKKSVVKPAQPKAPLQPPPSKSEVVIVPGHTKVEYHPITGAKIVIEKTTTGTQQTITTVLPDGRTTIQVKTFFDAVEIQDEVEEEEETWEETETVEPGLKTTTTTTTGAGNQSELQKAITEEQHVSSTQALSSKNIEVSSVEKKQQQQSTQVTKLVQESSVTSKQESQRTQVVKHDESNLQVAVSEPTITTVKKMLPSGEEVELQTVVSADGRSTTKRKVVNKPGEEIEIEETEETHTYEPGEVKITTTSKTYPVQSRTQALSQTEQQVLSKNTKHVEQTEVKQNKQENLEQTSQVQQLTKPQQQSTQQQQQTTKSHKTNSNTSVVEQSNVQNQQSTVFSTSSSKKTSSSEQTVSVTKDGVTATATQSSKKESGKDQSTTIVQDGQNVNIKSEKKATLSKERSEATTVDDQRQQQQALTQGQSQKTTTVDTKNQQKQIVPTGVQPGDVTTEEIRHFDGGREIIWKTVRADGTTKVESKIIYDSVEVEVEESVETKIEKGSKAIQQQQQQQQIQNTQNTKNQSTTQQQQKQQQQQVQKQQQNQQISKLTQEQQKKQQTTSQTTVVEQQTQTSNQQLSKTTVVQGQHQHTQQQTSNTKVTQEQQQHQLAKNQRTNTELTTKTIRSEIANTTTEPNGDVTTEEVRYFQGGREHIWRTSRADGTTAMRSKTFYDAVEIPCDPEEEEETEEYEETTTTESGPQDKKKLPPAPASNPVAPPRQKNVKNQKAQGKW